MSVCPICKAENAIVNQCRSDPNNLPTKPEYIGRFARSVESGWLGKVVAVEELDGDVLLKMHGVNTLCRTIAGGDIDDWVEEDDTQWFAPEDLRFVKLV